MLPKKYRLNLGKIRPGRILFTGRHLLIKSGENELPYGRFGVVISNRVEPKAVRRNLWRRKIFSWLEKAVTGAAGRDIVIILKKRPEREEEEQIKNELKNVLDF